MRSFIPLSLLLAVVDLSFAVTIPFEVVLPKHEDFSARSSRLMRRGQGAMGLQNIGNAQYVSNITLGGVQMAVLLDSGSSDLWVDFPGTPPATKDLGKSLSLSYAIGSASGRCSSTQLKFNEFTIEDQAFLQVTDASSFSTDIHKQGYSGLMGLGPNSGSQVRRKVGKDNGADTVLSRIFQQNSLSSNYITFLLDRKGTTQGFTGQFTIGEIASNMNSVTSMPKLDVDELNRLLKSDQHWQALTDKDNGVIGPDGNPLKIKSIVPRAPSGQLVAVFDSGFTFTQVPRDMADQIYGRVKGAVYDSKKEWWTIPCGQYLNVSFNFGGVNYPVHPLDTSDDNFNYRDASGNRMCIGSFQPITTAFSLLGNYDMIMGMNFMRNVYTLMEFGKWVDGTKDKQDPYLQLLGVTDVAKAKNDFVSTRLSGTDSSGDAQYQLLPADQMQKSPVSAEEKKKKYQEMILSRWPYILVGSLIGLLLIIGFIVYKCCCRRKKNAAARQLKAESAMFGGPPPRGRPESYTQLKDSPSTVALPLREPPAVHRSSFNASTYSQQEIPYQQQQQYNYQEPHSPFNQQHYERSSYASTPSNHNAPPYEMQRQSPYTGGYAQ